MKKEITDKKNAEFMMSVLRRKDTCDKSIRIITRKQMLRKDMEQIGGNSFQRAKRYCDGKVVNKVIPKVRYSKASPRTLANVIIRAVFGISLDENWNSSNNIAVMQYLRS